MGENELAGAGPFPGGKRYNSYGAFLRETFGCRVYKVVVDAGFTCPNRDGTLARGGCTYCSNDSFRPNAVSRFTPIRIQVEQGIEYLRTRYRARKFIVYFQPFSNTHAPLASLAPLYEEALSHPDVAGLSVGTRPDCVDGEKLAWLQRAAETHFVTIEYGLESIHDETLARINRGHDFRCWLRAMQQTRNRGIRICVHLILGFPWETRDQMLAMAEAVSAEGVDFLKIHHLHVLRHTAMGREYLSNPFRLLEFEEYLELVTDFLERLNPDIRIERLFGLAPAENLIGPLWGKNKAEVQAAIERTLLARNTWQGNKLNR
jgi:uncharacterized protein